MASKRSNGEGTIRQRPDGRWEARYIAGRKPDGSPIRRSVYGPTQAEVAKQLLDVRQQQETGQYVQPDKITVGQWLDTWFTEYVQPAKKASTATGYRDSITLHVKPYLATRHLQKLRPENVQAAYNALQKKGMAPATIKKAHVVLHAALDQAVVNRLIPSNPSERAVLPKQEQEEINPLTTEEQKRFVDALPDNVSGRALAFILGTGLRVSECCGLRWKDIKGEAFTVAQTIRRNRTFEGDQKTGLMIGTPKTRSSRRPIPLTPKLLALLAAQRRQQVEDCLKIGAKAPDLVFSTTLGTPTEARNLTRALHRVLDQTGIQRRGVHALRHTFATRAIEKGMDVRTLSEILGHSKVAITLQLYVHSDMDKKRAGMELMDDLL